MIMKIKNLVIIFFFLTFKTLFCMEQPKLEKTTDLTKYKEKSQKTKKVKVASQETLNQQKNLTTKYVEKLKKVSQKTLTKLKNLTEYVEKIEEEQEELKEENSLLKKEQFEKIKKQLEENQKPFLEKIKELMSTGPKTLISKEESEKSEKKEKAINKKIPSMLETFELLGSKLEKIELESVNDLLKLRRLYPKFQMLGGINKKILIKSSNQSIDEELEKVSLLMKQGGYIPHIDHSIPMDADWDKFKEYRIKLNKLIDGK